RGSRQDCAAQPAPSYLAVGDPDRNPDDAEAGPQRPVGRLDLERVALRVDRVEVDLLEHLAAVALEAAGEISDLRREQHARIEGTARGDRATRRAPVRNLPALAVAGTDGQS